MCNGCVKKEYPDRVNLDNLENLQLIFPTHEN